MKKFLFLVLFSLISVISYSQLIVRTYKNQAGTYDEIFKKWRFDEPRYSNISVRVEKGYFQFDDEAESLYRVIESEGEKIESSYKATTWVCRDEKNIYCRVQIIHYFENQSNVLTVIYKNICYLYHIKNIDDYSVKQ